MGKSNLSRRDFLRVSAGAAAGALLVACQPQVVEVEKEVEVEVTREVDVEVEVPGEEVIIEVTSTPPPQGKTQLVFYERAGNAQLWIDKYLESHNNLEISIMLEPPGQRMQSLIAAIAAGTAPDTIGLGGCWPGQLGEMGALVDLTDLQPVQDSLPLYSTTLMETDNAMGNYAGKVLGLSFWMDMSVMFYNKTFLEEAGGDPEVGVRSFDDIIAYGKAATKDDRVGFSLGIVNGFLFWPWLWAQGELTNDDWSESRADEQPFIDMVQFARDIVCVHKITNDAAATDWGTMMDLFNNQKAMLLEMGGGEVGLVRGEFPELWEVLGVCPIPGPKEGQKSSYVGGNVACVSTQTEHLDESVELAVWLTSSEDAMTITGEMGYMPSCPHGVDLPVYQQDYDIYQTFWDALEYGRPAPNHPKYEEVEDASEQAYMEAIMCEKPMDQIVADHHDELNKILHRV